MGVPGVIFDGDDTLWQTASLYVEAKQKFFSQMSSLGFDQEEVEKTFQDIDVANVHRLGFSKDRFPSSMTETYELFCYKYGLPLEQRVGELMRRIGYGVFAKVPPICAHAQEVLARLEPHYRLILATKGDYEVQRSKIDRSALTHFFYSTYILKHKTQTEIVEIAKDCDLDVSRSWVIGDSLKSDINPGLQVGFSAIWIKTESWHYETDEEIVSDKLFKVNELRDTLPLLISGEK